MADIIMPRIATPFTLPFSSASTFACRYYFADISRVAFGFISAVAFTPILSPSRSHIGREANIINTGINGALAFITITGRYCRVFSISDISSCRHRPVHGLPHLATAFADAALYIDVGNSAISISRRSGVRDIFAGMASKHHISTYHASAPMAH